MIFARRPLPWRLLAVYLSSLHGRSEKAPPWFWHGDTSRPCQNQGFRSSGRRQRPPGYTHVWRSLLLARDGQPHPPPLPGDDITSKPQRPTYPISWATTSVGDPSSPPSSRALTNLFGLAGEPRVAPGQLPPNNQSKFARWPWNGVSGVCTFPRSTEGVTRRLSGCAWRHPISMHTSNLRCSRNRLDGLQVHTGSAAAAPAT